MRPRVAIAVLLCAAAAAVRAAEPADGAAPTHAETMAAIGLVRHDGAWRTPQEIELAGRAERDAEARREWTKKVERLRRGLDRGDAAAAEQIREISDPLAVPAIVAALAADPQGRVRGLYLESLARIRTPEAGAALVATALDHADPETRIAAVERLAALGPGLSSQAFVAALGSTDNARVNRAAEALGRLGDQSAVAALIASLETRHVVMQGDGQAPGSTSATFTPAGGGLSMGGGPKPVKVVVRNDRVLESLVALTGQNFSWDAAAWRNWLAARECPAFDPRREP
ncbi:MAG: HEAT repeat domain-containing protein [Planctomycetaceae bacterium]